MAATRILPFALVAMACSHADPGITRAKAEAALQAYDYVDISLQATPNGWSGRAIPARGGYWMDVTVDQNGVIDLKPCGCGGR